MNLTALTTALHKWADKHGGQFPDAMLCSEAQEKDWDAESLTRFNQPLRGEHNHYSHFKGVRIYPFLTSDDPRILFALEPSD